MQNNINRSDYKRTLLLIFFSMIDMSTTQVNRIQLHQSTSYWFHPGPQTHGLNQSKRKLAGKGHMQALEENGAKYKYHGMKGGIYRSTYIS